MEADNLRKWFDLAGKEVEDNCARLLKEVERMRNAGAEIYPAQKNILRALKNTAPENVKAVILGQDPYHEPNQAMGLAFSVPKGEKLPPSLRNIFRELSDDLKVEPTRSGDLTGWTEQGVLLLNTVLTVEAHKANSHKKLGWHKITGEVIRACAALEQPVVFLCWGKPAIELADSAVKKFGRGKKLLLCSTHPSPLSANNRRSAYPAFIGSRPFGQANNFLRENGAEPVDWQL